MATCRACGRANPDDARFCGTCGTALPTAGPSPEAPPRPEGTGGSATWGWDVPAQGPPAPGAPPSGPDQGRPPSAPPPGAPGPYGQAPHVPVPAPGPPLPQARPAGVTAVAVWSLVAGPLFLLIGVSFAAMAPTLADDPAFQEEFERQVPPESADLTSPRDFADSIGILGAGMSLLAIPMAVAGWGLYQRRPWAWKLALGVTVAWLVMGLVLVVSVLLLPLGLLAMGVSAALLWYFTRPGVKDWLLRPAEPKDPWAELLQPGR